MGRKHSISPEKNLWDWKRMTMIGAGFLLLSIGLYGNTLTGNFVMDDWIFARRGELHDPRFLIQLWREPYVEHGPESGVYRPLTLLSFTMDVLLFGRNPANFHAINILLNGVVTFLVFVLIYRLFGRPVLAGIVALLFAFFPIHTEAVASIKSRDEILAALFAILSWLAFLRGTRGARPRVSWIVASSACFFLSLLAKETLFLAPALFLIVWMWKRPSRRYVFLVGLLYAVPFSLLMFLRYLILGEYAFGKDVAHIASNPLLEATGGTRFWTAFMLLVLYVQKIFLPYNLSASYYAHHLPLQYGPFTSWYVPAGIILLVLLTALAVWKKIRIRFPEVTLGSLIFLAGYFPISKFMFSGGVLFGERWMYFASLGPALLAGLGLERLYQWKKAIAVVSCVLVLGVYGYTTVVRNRVWLTERALAESMIVSAPRSVKGYHNLAHEYLQSGDVHNAKHYGLIASDIYPDFPPLLFLRGKIALFEGQFTEAEKFFSRAIELRPQQEQYEYLALTLAMQKRFTESFALTEKIYATVPRSPYVRFLMALNLYHLGRKGEAREFFDWTNAVSEAEKIRLIEKFHVLPDPAVGE